MDPTGYTGRSGEWQGRWGAGLPLISESAQNRGRLAEAGKNGQVMEVQGLSRNRPLWQAAQKASRPGRNEEVSGKGYLSPVFSEA
jgi:hypothetical protein